MSLSLNTKFKSIEFYYFADELYKSCSKEVDYRVIIGRAYYSAFLCAREYAGIKASGADVHKKVIDYFSGKNQTSISNRLKDLKGYRHNADYDLDYSAPRRDAQKSLGLAKAILLELKILSQ